MGFDITHIVCSWIRNIVSLITHTAQWCSCLPGRNLRCFEGHVVWGAHTRWYGWISTKPQLSARCIV